jgi:hypothetical protein
LKFRPNTNEYSIIQNIKLDSSKLFRFYKNSFVGLSSKSYDETFILMKTSIKTEIKTWEERYNDFAQFISINNRLPFSTGCPDEEIKLYRWYNVQEGKIKTGKLDDEKCNLLRQTTSQFIRNDNNRKRRSNNTERYVGLKQFIFLNNRLPSANKTGEENLYQFFYKQRKLFEQGALEQFEENKFIELVKIIENIKYENKRN